MNKNHKKISQEDLAWAEMMDLFLRNEREKKKMKEMNVIDLRLSTRAYKALWRARIRTVGDLQKYKSIEDIKVKGYGAKTYKEIAEKMEELGIVFEG